MSGCSSVGILARDVPDIWFWLTRYPAIFYYPIPDPDPAKMLNGTRYRNWICYYLQVG